MRDDHTRTQGTPGGGGEGSPLPPSIDRYRVRRMRRAIYADDMKLMSVGGQPDEMFNVKDDPAELNNILDNPFGYENKILELQKQLEDYVLISEAHRDGGAKAENIDYSDNPELLERLRGLGYIE